MKSTELAEIKDAVRLRDGMRCTVCGVTNDEHKATTGKQLEVHRVQQGSAYSAAPGACVTLCRKCHDGEPRKIRTREERERDHAAYLAANPPRPRRLTAGEVLAGELRAARAAVRLSLKEAAEKSGVHYVTISKYEGGKKLPTLDALYRLAEAYGVEAASLVPPNAMGKLPTKRDAKPKK